MKHFNCLIGRFRPFWLLVFLFVITACGGAEESAVLPTTAAVVTTPTLPSPTPAATATTTMVMETAVPTLPPLNAAFMGVQFGYDETVWDTPVAELLPPIPLQPGPGTGLPERIRFAFAETADEYIIPRDPQILIYPAKDYEALTEGTAQKMAALRLLLQQQPPTTETPIPLLPVVNATELFHSQLNYLNFQNGSGLRYLTLYAQAYLPLANDNVFYTFQGLTADGNYYVAAFFPISSTVLPDTGNQVDIALLETAENYASYISGMSDVLNGVAATDFTPNLTTLDNLMRSLLITPDTTFPAANKPVGVVFEGVSFVYDSLLAAGVTPEKLPAQLTNPDGTTTPLEGMPDRYQFTFAAAEERPFTLHIQTVRDSGGDFYEALPTDQQQFYTGLQEQLLAQAAADSTQEQMAYLSFLNGNGQRYLSSLASEPEPVTSENLFYVFEGFTQDGASYVRLEFGVGSDGIPPLDQLDQLIQSLYIDTATLAPPSLVNPADCTDDLDYVDDITIPDNTRLTAGQPFTKIWQVLNSGTCTWDGGYQWVYVAGEQFQASAAISFPAIVQPGETFDIGLDMVAPTSAGSYQGWWQLQNPAGTLVGSDVYLLVEVP